MPLHAGNQQDCIRFCRTRLGYYVYILRRPDQRPFYVGKGTGDRLLHHENEARHPNGHKSNAHKLNIIRSIWRLEGIGYEIDSWHAEEASAYRREAELITLHRRLHEGGVLANRAPGGCGRSITLFQASTYNNSCGMPTDNPERAVLNRFVLAIGKMDSVVIKPASQFRPKPTQRYPSKTISLKPRTAVAFVAAAAAQGVLVRDGAVISRRLSIDGIEGFLENGVCCDLLTAGVIDLLAAATASDERLQLRSGMASKVIGLVGAARCRELGVSGD